MTDLTKEEREALRRLPDELRRRVEVDSTFDNADAAQALLDAWPRLLDALDAAEDERDQLQRRVDCPTDMDADLVRQLWFAGRDIEQLKDERDELRERLREAEYRLVIETGCHHEADDDLNEAIARGVELWKLAATWLRYWQFVCGQLAIAVQERDEARRLAERFRDQVVGNTYGQPLHPDYVMPWEES